MGGRGHFYCGLTPSPSPVDSLSAALLDSKTNFQVIDSSLTSSNWAAFATGCPTI
jgi:hypothetical protein